MCHTHLSEELMQVPYRKMITITGDVKFSNLDIRYKNDFDFYARDLDLDPHLGGYQKIVNELVEDGSWQKINIGTRIYIAVKQNTM